MKTCQFFFFLLTWLLFIPDLEAQYLQWLTTNPVSFVKSDEITEQELLAKKYHIKSLTLIDHKGIMSGHDTVFEPERIVYTRIFDSTGNILTDKWGESETIYKYDNNNLIWIYTTSGDTSHLYYDKNNRLVYKIHSVKNQDFTYNTAYFYYPDGKLLKHQTYRVNHTGKTATDSAFAGYYEWEYDALGRIRKLKEEITHDVFSSAVIDYKYTPGGETIISDSVSWKFSLTYDSSGREIAYRSLDGYKGLDSDYLRDKEGNIISVINPATGKPTCVYQNKYDAAGLFIHYYENVAYNLTLIHSWDITYTFYK